MIETLTWKGFTYSVKPFTLDTLYSLWETIGTVQDSGRMLRGVFEGACQTLLSGNSKEAHAYLISGELAKAVLTSEDVEAAIAFKGRVDFLSQSFTNRGQELMKSAPDLTDKLQAKASKALAPQSRKATKGEPAHSG